MIEWGEAILPTLPGDYLQVTLGYGEGDDDRTIALEPVGRWAERAESLAHRAEGCPGAEPC